MDYYVSQVAFQEIRWDKPSCLQDTSVPEYLKESRHDREQRKSFQTKLWEIITSNIQFYPYKKFGTANELIRILDGIMKEICWQEMESALEYYDKSGITKTVNYLLSCVE